MLVHLLRRLLACATISALAACSGGATLTPALNNQAPAPQAQSAGAGKERAVVRFRIAVPGRTRSHGAHRPVPSYVSASTAKAVIVVQGQNENHPEAPQTFTCTSICTGNATAPLGVDNFVLKLEDKNSHVLSTGEATVLLFKATGNTLNLTLDGVVKSVDLTPVPGVLPVVPSARGYVLFNGRDADGNLIMPDGNYVDATGNAQTFDVVSSSKNFVLAATTVSAPGAPISFSYNAPIHVGSVKLTPKAHAGTTTSATFKNATVSMIPGIASRLAPPLPLLVSAAQQLPVPTAASSACGGLVCFNAGALFVLGSDGGQATELAYFPSNGSYVQADAASVGGPFANPPVLLSNGVGFFGYIEYGNNLFGNEYDTGNSISTSGVGSANPCTAGSPIGQVNGKLYCQVFGVGSGYVNNNTDAVLAAYGQDRTIVSINAVTYITSVTNSAQQVYTGGSAVTNAISVGTIDTSQSSTLFGQADGTVTTGAQSVAKFKHAVQNVVGHNADVYVVESGLRFGVKNAAGTFETLPLPIGNVVQIAETSKGPILVESDGTLDFMAF